MASATEKEMLDPALPGTTLLFACSMPRSSRASSSAAPSQARCRCSRERIDRVLRSIRARSWTTCATRHGRSR